MEIKSVLLISTCHNKLHELEFVKPLEGILQKKSVKFVRRHYSDVRKEDLGKCSRVIICGTSLQDNFFIQDLNLFNWLKFFNKPVLGICAGMQILGLIYGGKIKKKTEIGFFHENFSKEFLGINEGQEVYHLHNNFIDFKRLPFFEVYSENNKIVQAVKHKTKHFYGVLFHPEVRQKKMVEEFIKNG